MPVIKGVSGIAEISEHLYLCGIQSVDALKIRLMGITHVINLTIEAPNVSADDVTCERIALDDSPHAQLCAHFDACADKIESVRRAGGRTLVHCMAGASRSVTICIAYLMKHQSYTLRDAYHKVRLKRPIARPNVGFFRQLIDYERRLFGDNTVRMVESPMGFIPDVYLAQTQGLMWMDGSDDATGDAVSGDAVSGDAVIGDAVSGDTVTGDTATTASSRSADDAAAIS